MPIDNSIDVLYIITTERSESNGLISQGWFSRLDRFRELQANKITNAIYQRRNISHYDETHGYGIA